MNLLIAAFVSALPVIELRGGIPLALLSGASIWEAFAACVAANIVIIPLIFLFLDFLHSRLLALKWYKWFADKIINHVRAKAHKVEGQMKAWGYIALMIFVAIPLPGTGAWTGSLIAWLLGLKRKNSLIAIALGVVIAGLLVLAITDGLINIFG